MSTMMRAVSIMYPAVIMIPRSVGGLMQMRLICLVQMAILLVLTYLHTAVTILYHVQIVVDIYGLIFLLVLW